MGIIVNGPRSAGTHAVRSVLCTWGFSDTPGGIMRGVYWPSRDDRLRGRGRRIEELELEDDQVIGAHEPELITPYPEVRILREPAEIVISLFRKTRRSKFEKVPRRFVQWIRDTPTAFSLTAPFFVVPPPPESYVLQYRNLFDVETQEELWNWAGITGTFDYVDPVTAREHETSTWSGEASKAEDWLKRAEDRALFDDLWETALEDAREKYG